VNQGGEPLEEVWYSSHSKAPELALACKFVKAGGARLALIPGTALLIAVVEDVEVILISDFAETDIGDEFHDQGLANNNPSNQKGV
jgi:hypothetical protein